MRIFSLLFFFATLFNSPLTHSKIVTHNGEFFVVTNQQRVPIFMVNHLVEKGEINRIKLFGGGNAHLISFAKNEDKKEKLYSVDEKGYIYSISPFTDFSVTDVDDQGKFKFQEVRDRIYFINQKGFFLY